MRLGVPLSPSLISVTHLPQRGFTPAAEYFPAAYRDGVDRNTWPLGIRPGDLVIMAVVIAVIELNVTVGGGDGAAPLNVEAYVLGAVIALPLLLRRRWPLLV